MPAIPAKFRAGGRALPFDLVCDPHALAMRRQRRSFEHRVRHLEQSDPKSPHDLLRNARTLEAMVMLLERLQSGAQLAEKARIAREADEMSDEDAREALIRRLDRRAEGERAYAEYLRSRMMADGAGKGRP